MSITVTWIAIAQTENLLTVTPYLSYSADSPDAYVVNLSTGEVKCQVSGLTFPMSHCPSDFQHYCELFALKQHVETLAEAVAIAEDYPPPLAISLLERKLSVPASKAEGCPFYAIGIWLNAVCPTDEALLSLRAILPPELKEYTLTESEWSELIAPRRVND